MITLAETPTVEQRPPRMGSCLCGRSFKPHPTSQAFQMVPRERDARAAALLETVSRELGVRITRVIRYRGKPNLYAIEVSGLRIFGLTIKQLTSQTIFRRRVFDRTGACIRYFTRGQWWDLLGTLAGAIVDMDQRQVLKPRGGARS